MKHDLLNPQATFSEIPRLSLTNIDRSGVRTNEWPIFMNIGQLAASINQLVSVAYPFGNVFKSIAHCKTS